MAVMSSHLLKVFEVRLVLYAECVPYADPPDELVVLAPQLPQKPKLVPSQSRSLLMRWKAVMCDSGLHCTRLGLATITGIMHY